LSRALADSVGWPACASRRAATPGSNTPLCALIYKLRVSGKKNIQIIGLGGKYAFRENHDIIGHLKEKSGREGTS